VREYFIIDSDNKEVISYYLANKKFIKQLSVKWKNKIKNTNEGF
jgi:hypothetical protein